MKYRVTHTTEYRYEGGEVSSSYSVAHLVPRRLGHQTCLSSDLAISPKPLDYRERFDFFDNRTSFFSIHEPHRSLRVTATSEVDVTPPGGQLQLQESEAWDAFSSDVAYALPGRWSDTTSASASGRAPARSRRSRTRTPRHDAFALQPSTQTA